MQHVNKHNPPANLCREEFVLVRVSRHTRNITLYMSDKTSYDLGSFWRSHEQTVQRVFENGVETMPHVRRGARVYLTQALGCDEAFVDLLLAVAHTNGAAVVEVGRKQVFPYRGEPNHEATFGKFLRKHEPKDPQQWDSPVYVDSEDVGEKEELPGTM